MCYKHEGMKKQGKKTLANKKIYRLNKYNRGRKEIQKESVKITWFKYLIYYIIKVKVVEKCNKKKSDFPRLCPQFSLGLYRKNKVI